MAIFLCNFDCIMKLVWGLMKKIIIKDCPDAFGEGVFLTFQRKEKYLVRRSNLEILDKLL